ACPTAIFPPCFGALRSNMFKAATQLPTYPKYVAVLKKALKRLKKMQTAQNAKDNRGSDGSQKSDLLQSIRYFNEYKFDDKKDKQPHAVLVVGKKVLVNKIVDEMADKANKVMPTKPSANGKGVLYWHQ